jgi:hypothetical protein
MHRQLRALTILDALISNAGTRFQRTFADEPLLERLRLMPRDDMVDPDVRAKCNTLYREWAQNYKSTPGLTQIATLYKQLPQTRKLQPSQSRVIRETEAEAARESRVSPPSSPVGHSPSNSFSQASSSRGQRTSIGPGSTSSGSSFFGRSKDKDKDKDKKGNNKQKPFNLEREKGAMLEVIAEASIASTNLINAIKLINRESQRVSDNAECRRRFDRCKSLRRRVLRYIQLVESEQYIGGLLSANDELVKALMAYEVMDKSIDDDSDSDVDAYVAGKARFEETKRASSGAELGRAMGGLALAASPPKQPPRPVPAMPVPKRQVQEESEEEVEDEDDDNPFADRNAVKTPGVEKGGMMW